MAESDTDEFIFNGNDDTQSPVLVRFESDMKSTISDDGGDRRPKAPALCAAIKQPS